MNGSPVNDEVRALLKCHKLDELSEAIAALGIGTLHDLLFMNNERKEMVYDLFEERDVPRKAERSFFAWLEEKRGKLALQPPPGSLSAHFYGLCDALNTDDISGLEAATILRVDIDPFADDDTPSAVPRIPPGAIDTQVQAAEARPVATISLVGPTGVGKSFLTSSFMERDSPTGVWPVVAKPGQSVPTSAHVCLHRGFLQPGCESRTPLVLLDFEGEDGRIPRTLMEQGMRKMSRLRNLVGMSALSFQTQMDATIKTRQNVVKNMLPPLAYLISDVVVFIDTVEPRRTERAERIRSFAAQAHTTIPSVDYKPALVIVQNKWIRGEHEASAFDVSDEYEWIRKDLQEHFSSVTILRIPPASDRHMFEDSLYALHSTLQVVVGEVHQQRERDACLYSEREFWFAFRSLVQQLGQSEPRLKALSHFVDGNRASRSPADNALRALSKFWPLDGPLPRTAAEWLRAIGLQQYEAAATSQGILKIELAAALTDADCERLKVAPRDRKRLLSSAALLAKRLEAPDSPDPATFAECVGKVLEWYAYSLAGEARQQDEEGQRQTIAGLPALHARILKVCSDAEPCTAVYTDPLSGQKYPCTQRRCGHSCEHRNPAMLSRPSENLLKRIFSFGLWKDTRPCVWSEPEGFQAHAPPASLGEFQRLFMEFLRQPAGSYQSAFRPASDEWNTTGWVNQARLVASSTESGDEDLCMLCLRPSSDMVVLPDSECRHFLCRQCVLTRKALSSDASRYESTGEIEPALTADKVVCPFCLQTSTLKSTPSDDNGFRILSLDGGGVRGLIEVLVLKEVEKVFHPLPISSLFDLIMGTSAGGIVSMALHAEVPLEKIEEFLANEAAGILDTNPIKTAWCHATGMSVCDSRAFKKALHSLLGNARLHNVPGPPYFMCTVFNATTNETEVCGSYPSTGKRQVVIAPVASSRAAYATAAAPTFFEAVTWVVSRTSGSVEHSFVDGGIRANCPAKLAVKFATEFQLDSRAESSTFVEMIASLGTGLERPHLTAPRANGLTWATKLISFALDSEQLWRDGILDNDALSDVPKVRVNPPDLGSLDPFVSASIPGLRSGMIEYFASDAGKRTMGKLIHLVHAKLWHVRLQTNLVAGAAVQMHIEMREHRLDFSAMSPPALRKIIEDRRDPTVTQPSGRLCEVAKAAFSEQPFVPPLQGKFVISFSGTEHELPGREFVISSAEPGTPQLHVWWRSDFGDFPISGFPRSIRVIGEKQGSCPAPGPTSGP